MENLETIPTNGKPRDNRPMENREIVFLKIPIISYLKFLIGLLTGEVQSVQSVLAIYIISQNLSKYILKIL